MPAHPWQTNFTAGELTEQLLARTDWQKYQNGAACLKNFVVRPHGGAARRAGTVFIGEAKFQATRVRLVPFEFSTAQAYVLEFGDLYIRFWANRAPVLDGGVPVEVATPYVVDDLRALRFEQSADVLYIAHPDYAPRKLQRLSATAFQLDVITFVPPPTFEPLITPTADLTLTATTGTVTATASATAFLEADVGRQIRSGVGRGVIIDFTSSTVVTLDILDAFPSTSLAQGDWTMDGSPNTTILVSHTQPRGTLVTVLAELDAFRSTDVGKYLLVDGGTLKLTAFTDAKTVTAQIIDELDTPIRPGPTSVTTVGTALTSTAHTLARGDGVKLVTGPQIGEIRRIASVTDADTATLETAFSANQTGEAWEKIIPTGGGAWTLEIEAWSTLSGFPGTVALHGQRLWWAGSPAFPDRVWGSVVADFESHARGVLDDDAVEFVLATSGVNLIRWMKGLQAGLALGTVASETTLDGGTEAPITPTNVRARERTTYGASFPVDGIRAGHVVFFLQRGEQRVREFAFSIEADSYTAPDLSIIAEHLTRQSGIVEMDYASSPDSILFAVRADGILLALTYERAENVVGWSHHETQGVYESVAVIPNGCASGDEVWVAVHRTTDQGNFFATNFFHADYLNGNYLLAGGSAQHRYLEAFDGNLDTDSGLVYSGAAAGAFSGLAHLEGLTVKAITADGTVYDLVVSAGQITLPNSATTTALEAGLHFTSTLVTLRPELPTSIGTAQARIKHWNHVTVRVYCTSGELTLNGEVLEYPTGASDPYTGDLRRIMRLGWDREGQLTLQTLEPKACTVLGITGALQLDDG